MRTIARVTSRALALILLGLALTFTVLVAAATT